MTKEIKDTALDPDLDFISKASRYLGNEINSVHKNLAEVDITFALAFPDIYEVGMSHTGMHILYEHINSYDWIACERVYAPWVDMLERMQSQNRKLHTLENQIPVRDCDIVGFSVEYELACSNILLLLELSGIPLLSSDRDTTFPLVIAGGPCTYNPEPLADFIDAFVIGEGEEISIEICEAVRAVKSNKPDHDKTSLLNILSKIKGIYVPSFFNTTENKNGLPQAVIPSKKGYETVTKRIMQDFTHAPSCTNPVVPYLQVIHDRAAIEIARGCTRGCRFCMAGMVYRPTREKNAECICSLARESLRTSGYEELGLLSLSSSDHSCIQQVLPELMQQAESEMIAVSLPSLRVDSLAPALMDEIKKVRKTGFTIAPEAGTQRLRDVINKGITHEEILTTATRIFDAGWNLVKLYFMIGLPTETDRDLDGIVDLARTIAGLNRRKQVTVSISTFVPKPHTPFQWEALDSADDILRKQRYIMDRLRSRNIKVKCHDHQLSLLEGVFARGDRHLGRLLLEAHTLGAGFESWSEHFKPDLWDQAFTRSGIDRQNYLKARPVDAPLPWDHISCGVDKQFLKAERSRAFTGSTTTDCRQGSCHECGVCNSLKARLEIAEHNATGEQATDVKPPPEPPSLEIPKRYRINYSKTGPARFLSHLELTRVFSRAMRRAKLPLKFSGGFHPMPKISFHNALPVGLQSEEEWCDVLLLHDVPSADILKRCAPQFPAGISIAGVTEISLKNKSVIATMLIYQVRFPQHVQGAPDPEKIREMLNRFNQCDTFMLEVVRKKGTKSVDLKKVVRTLTVENNCSLLLQLNPAAAYVPRINEIIEKIFDLTGEIRLGLEITKLRS